MTDQPDAPYQPDVLVVRRNHGRLEILQAPPRVEFSWQLLCHLEPTIGRKDGDMLYLPDGIIYKLTEVNIAMMTCSGVRLA
jgi:hypothetical protein